MTGTQGRLRRIDYDLRNAFIYRLAKAATTELRVKMFTE